MENYLPDFCYNTKTPIKINGIVIHYISAINVDPTNALDTQANWNLLFDLNRKAEDRLYYPMKEVPNRMFASYHSLIGRDGEERLCVPEANVAYHAGRSIWLGKPNCNYWMYGISLIGTKSSGFTDAQYNTLEKRCAALMKEYKFFIDNIVGHEQVSPGRKVDPGIATGNFDMARVIAAIVDA